MRRPGILVPSDESDYLLEQSDGHQINQDDHTYFIAYMKDIIQLDSNETNCATAIQESNRQRRFRKIVKMLAIAFGSTAGIPYFTAGLAAAKNHFPLGYILGIATVIAQGGATTWVMHALTNKMTPNAIVESNMVTTKAIPVGRHILCNFLGLATSASTVYVISRYTNSVLLMGMGFGTDYSYRTLGYYTLSEVLIQLWRHFRKRSRVTNVAPENISISTEQHHYAHVLKQHVIPYLLENPEEIGNTFVWDPDKTDQANVDTFFLKLNRLVAQFSTHSSDNQKNDRTKRNIQITSLFIPICNASTSFYFNSRTAGAIWNNSFFVYPLTTLLVLSDFSLDTLGTFRSTGQIVDAKRGVYNGGIHVSRKTTNIIIFCCSIVAILSACIDGFIVKNNLSEDNNPSFYRKTSLFFGIIYFLTVTLFRSFSLSVTTNNFSQAKATYSKDELARKQAISSEKLCSLSATMSGSKLILFSNAIKQKDPTMEEPNNQDSEGISPNPLD